MTGSFSLGGYDPARFVPNELSFALAGNDSKSPIIGIQSITTSGTLTNPNNTLLSNGISALIDTALPHIWLPYSACQAFEEAFGLSWDSSKELYLVNDTTHQRLATLNPSITFALGNLAPQSKSVNITMPYGAFNLQASSPIYPNGTNYFPLRRASSEDQYTLGRAFLQEAYLIVDFEQSNFSVSQAQFPANASPNLVNIDHSPQLHSTNTSSPSSSHSWLHTNRPGIAGVVVGSSVAFILLCTFAFFVLRSFRRRQQSEPQRASDSKSLSNPGVESWPSSATFSHPESGTMRTVGADVRELGASQSVTILPTYASASSPSMGASERSRQELPGSSTAKELPQTPRNSRSEKRIYELAADESWLAHRKR